MVCLCVWELLCVSLSAFYDPMEVLNFLYNSCDIYLYLFRCVFVCPLFVVQSNGIISLSYKCSFFLSFLDQMVCVDRLSTPAFCSSLQVTGFLFLFLLS